MARKAMENRSMNSLISTSYTDVEKKNIMVFMDTLSKLDPDLWLIKSYLVRNKINAAILPPVIEALAKVNEGSGWGRVEIEIREHRAIKCRGIDDRLLELDLVQPPLV